MASMSNLNNLNYVTIDPLIMETLNLNQKRIHRILDILHGKDPDAVPIKNTITHRHRMSSPTKQYSSSHKAIIQEHNHNFPIIKVSKGNNNSDFKYQMPKIIKLKNTGRSRGSSVILNKNLVDQTQKIIEQNSKKNKLQYQYSKNMQRALSPKSKPQSKMNYYFQQNRLKKNQQVVNDYLSQNKKAKRSKSLQINPQDVYRLDIQTCVAELTPIEQLQQCQKKMKRVKRRYQHLKTFDKKYYSSLNQEEFNQLV